MVPVFRIGERFSTKPFAIPDFSCRSILLFLSLSLISRKIMRWRGRSRGESNGANQSAEASDAKKIRTGQLSLENGRAMELKLVKSDEAIKDLSGLLKEFNATSVISKWPMQVDNLRAKHAKKGRAQTTEFQKWQSHRTKIN